MILVDDAGGEWPIIGQAPWNGVHLADFVMPFFLFIVGMAIALALKVCSSLLLLFSSLKSNYVLVLLYGHVFLLVQRIPSRHLAIRKVVLRTLKLLFFGILLQGQFFLQFRSFCPLSASL